LALFLVAAFSLAGFAHSFWLRWPGSQALAIPIDGGRTFRGRRIFGDNKTWRGFAVMVPAAGFFFFLIALAIERFFGGVEALGLWPLESWQYGLLGLWTGFFFMACELPNSFLKRQLDVAPGAAPVRAWAKVLAFLFDRFDSLIGLLASAAVFVVTPWQLWLMLLVAGTFVHWLFSVLLYAFGVKKRPA
jgi:CDP-diglyceride synthetase